MKRDSLSAKIPSSPFQAKLLHECWACHSVGLKPGVLETHLGDYGVRDVLSRRYEVLALTERGLCGTCEANPPAELAGPSQFIQTDAASWHGSIQSLGTYMSPTSSPTWKQLEENWGNGFESLKAEEQEALALWWLEAETMNGTLNQFFWNSSGNLALIALSGLRSLNAPITLKAFTSALEFFGESYPVDRDERMIRLEEIEAVHGQDVFTPASRIIQDIPEDFVQAAVSRLDALYART